MHQDATWYGGRPQPRGLCVRWGPGTPLPKKEAEPSPIFGPCLLWPNCWMDQGGTWHGGRPWSRPHCARWGHSSPPPKRDRPPILAHVYCDQTAGWIKTPLGTEVDLGPRHFVLDRFPAIGERGTAAPPPLFGPYLLWPRSPISATAELLLKFFYARLRSKSVTESSLTIPSQRKIIIYLYYY